MSKDRLYGTKPLQKGLFEQLEAEEIKKNIDIVDLIQAHGVKLTKKGSSYVGLCPFHDDKNPSLTVSKEKGVYHCFGCDAGGDIVEFIERLKGLTFKETLVYLKGKEYIHSTPKNTSSGKPVTLHHIEGHGARPTQSMQQTITEALPLDQPAILPVHNAMTLSQVMDYYHKKLMESKEAREYLTKRGLGDPVLWNRFKIGFSDGSLPSILSEAQTKEMITTGILKDVSSSSSSQMSLEHFLSCIVFPIFNDQEQVVGMYGRCIEETTTFPHRYLKGEHRGVFNRKASKVYDEVILTESIIDCLSLVSIGIENVQALYGINGFTQEHKKLLENDRVKTVVLAFDNDDAGTKGSNKYMVELVAMGFQVKVITPENVKDWNEWLCTKSSPQLKEGCDELLVNGLLAKETIARQIQEAVPIMPKEDAFSLRIEQGIYCFSFGEYTYHLIGVPSVFVGSLKVTVKAVKGADTSSPSGSTERFYDTVELFSSRSRISFSNTLGRAWSIEPKVIEKQLLDMLGRLEKERDKSLTRGVSAQELTGEEKALGMSLLQSPTIMDDIVQDMETLGYIGDDLNKQLLYLVATSRKLPDPLSVILVSESASGKSYLIETVEKLLPPTEVVSVTSLSDQALNYVAKDALVHKFLTLGEAVHSESVEHHIREMLSSKRLSRMVTLKDEKTGELTTRMIQTEAIVATAMSTTNTSINPENASRCFIVTSDESVEQTQKIHAYQRKRYEAGTALIQEKEKESIIKKHRIAQQLLLNRTVVIPYASYLTYPVRHMRTRRDHDRFLDLLAAVCFLRQYQKEIKVKEDNNKVSEYIECDSEDYRIAYRIMVDKILSATMSEYTQADELLYEGIREIAREKAEKEGLKITEVHCTQREIREYTEQHIQWIKMHLRKLTELEYIAVGGVNGRGTRHTYRLITDEPLVKLGIGGIMTPETLEIQWKK